VTAWGLPSGLTLDPDSGAITGTPDQAGVYEFMAGATDAAGVVGTSSCRISIAQPGGTTPNADVTSLSGSDDTADRWQDTGGALHAVTPVAIACSAYPCIVTLWDISGEYGRTWRGWFQLAEDCTIRLGALGSKAAVYPPVMGAENRTLIAAVGTYDELVDPTDPDQVPNAFVSAPYSVAAPPAPGTDWGIGSWIDAIVVNTTSKQWGWSNLYGTLPFTNPNFKGARWTVQNGHYTTPGDASTFVAGSATTAQHGGKEVPFTDYDANTAYRMPGTDIVSIQNNNPSTMWTIPDYVLADGTLNPDNVFRLRQLIGSPLEQTGVVHRVGMKGGASGDAVILSNTVTWVYQNDWSSAVGVPPPGTNPYLDIVFDLSHGTQNATNLNPSTIGNGLQLSGAQLAAKLKALGGLAFDGSGNTIASLGYTMAINGSGQIVVSNLPAVLGLPALPSAAYPQGAVILNTADSKVYRNTTGSAWVKSADPADLVAGAVATGVSIAASQITAGTLVVGVAYAGQINAGQVNAGTFNGLALALTKNGITVTIDSIYNVALSGYYGMSMTGYQASYGTCGHYDLPGAVLIYNQDGGAPGSGGTLICQLARALVGGGGVAGGGYFMVGDTNSPQHQMVITPAGIYYNVGASSTQIAGPRQTGVGAPSGFSDATAQAFCTRLYNALSAYGAIS
jgi:hypothetical protein